MQVRRSGGSGLRGQRIGVAVSAMALALVAAACGSDNSSSGISATTSSAATAGAATTSAAAGATSTTATATTVAGGAASTAGAATGTPIKIGLINLESSAADYSEYRTSTEAVLKWTNETGGINGHPLEYDICKVDLTPESAVFCANKFVDEGVPMVFSIVDFYDDAATEVLAGAGIPIVTLVSPGVKTAAAVGEVFSMLPASANIAIAELLVGSEQTKAKNVSLMVLDSPTWVQLYSTYMPPVAAKLGITLNSVTYPPQGADWTAIAATILSTNPEFVFDPTAGDPDCLGFVPALRGAGYTKTIDVGSCQDSLAQIGPTGLAGGIFRPLFVFTPDMADQAPPEVKADLDIMKKYVPADLINQGWPQIGFGLAADMVNMLKQVKGDYTAANIKATFPTLKFRKFASRVVNNCDGSAWPGQNSCSPAMDFVKIDENGAYTLLYPQPYVVAPEFQRTA